MALWHKEASRRHCVALSISGADNIIMLREMVVPSQSEMVSVKWFLCWEKPKIGVCEQCGQDYGDKLACR